MSSDHGFSTLGSKFSNVRHPLAWMIVVGLLLHILVSMLQFVYDNDYWALVIRNLEAGEGLYGVMGYYYTPVWGYVLSLVSAFQSVFLNLGVDVLRVPEFFFSEFIESEFIFCSATVPSIAFSLTVKAPLILSNLAMAFLLRYLVIDVTKSDSKGNLAFMLIFFSPLVISAACINAMPDTIAAFFAVLTIVLVRRNQYLVAGMTFAIAVLTKFFPAFLLFPLVAYVLVKGGDVREGSKNVVKSMVGAIMMSCIIFLPQILEGNLDQCFQFLTDRTGDSFDDSLFAVIAGKSRLIVYSLVLLASAFIGYRVFRAGSDRAFDNLMTGSFLAMAICMLYPPTPQYIIILMPFLVYWAVVCDRRYMRCWGAISISGFIFSLSSTFLLLLPIAAWTGLLDTSWLASLFAITLDGSLSLASLWSTVFGALTYFSILSIFAILVLDWKKKGGCPIGF